MSEIEFKIVPIPERRPLVQRPDLTERTWLSKSTLSLFDMCGNKSWFNIHDRLPVTSNERMTFGSALDAAVEQLLTAARAGIPVTEARPIDAAEEVIARDGVEVDIVEIATACDAFVRDVLPRYDWSLVGLQLHLHEDIPGIGEVDGHPDVRLQDGSVYDVKSSARAKPIDAAATSIELGFYALLSEASGVPCPTVGYWTWCRTAKPSWQAVSAPVTDEMRRRTREVVLAYQRAKAADDVLNAGVVEPKNWSMNAGPKNLGLCTGCQYNPNMGGGCRIAVQGGASDVTG